MKYIVVDGPDKGHEGESDVFYSDVIVIPQRETGCGVFYRLKEMPYEGVAEYRMCTVAEVRHILATEGATVAP